LATSPGDVFGFTVLGYDLVEKQHQQVDAKKNQGCEKQSRK
jgi:hypothetical protein